MAADWGQINQMSERIIGRAFAVSNGLGSGFLEKVYENALAHELRKAGLSVAQQHAMVARYDGVVVGEYVADLLVESLVLVELKHARVLDDVHFAQCLNYLKVTGLRLLAPQLRQASRRNSENLAMSPSDPRASVFICGQKSGERP